MGSLATSSMGARKGLQSLEVCHGPPLPGAEAVGMPNGKALSAARLVHYVDKKSGFNPRKWAEAIKATRTVYVGNLGFCTREDRVLRG